MSMRNVVDATTPPKVFQAGHESIWRVSFSPDSDHFVSVGGDSVRKEAGSRTWPTNDKMEAQRRRSKKSERLDRSPYPIASEFEKYHGVASINKWNVPHQQLSAVEKLNTLITSFQSPSLLSTSNSMLLDKTMQVWDVTTGNHMCSVYSVVLSPLDRKYITSGSSDKTSKLAL